MKVHDIPPEGSQHKTRVQQHILGRMHTANVSVINIYSPSYVAGNHHSPEQPSQHTDNTQMVLLYVESQLVSRRHIGAEQGNSD